MQYRRLGGTGLQVSVIGFGGAAVSGASGGYGFGDIAEKTAHALLLSAYEQGITLFDTAPIYGYGESERRFGKALGAVRDKVVIASKCGVCFDARKRVAIDNRPDVVRRMLEQSLRDLDSDYIDIYLVHWPDRKTPIEATVQALAAARERGQVRHIGLSNCSTEDIRRALAVAPIAVLQHEHNLFSREAARAVLPLAAEQELGFMGYGTLDKGILTGRVTADRAFESCDVRASAPWWTRADRSTKYAAMREIAGLLATAGHTGLELALASALALPTVSTALCGMKSEQQVRACVAALAHLPPAEVVESAAAAAAAAGACS
ncbi:MAG: aldo/keto reductase [Candidatus Schekmanbacteria bacterium]|nr:aldo/keto reductase [Candidatus Schekmanbacteria bacterium]